ncbi:MAG: CDP-diacylglycerol--serine O-phosphatidyltransferase [Clostridiales bacterium]|jgi:CDP-diacylglycerol--serine O-phosphatidyltransferase|nr:CDP-diacylglycerol--serine O-phosphatidyltransferase [Clostridiales bacterium]
MLKHLPNLLTLLNLSIGLVAVLLVIQPSHPHKTLIIPALILLGGIIDFFDGFLARRLRASSQMGKQLDSFADIITFGVAPILLINYISHTHPTILIVVSIAYALAAAYRLARFNLHDFSRHFQGLPITAAGLILAAYAAVYPQIPVITPALILALSALMISKRKIKRLEQKTPPKT